MEISKNLLPLTKTFNRYVFKDEKAFKENYNAICYIPESEYDDATSETNSDYLDLDLIRGYTHNDFISMCNGNEEVAEILFNEVGWEHPETLLSKLDFVGEDCDFIKVGGKVYWNDPEELTSGVYEVVSIRGNNGKEAKVNWWDDFILLSNDGSEVECTADECSEVNIL